MERKIQHKDKLTWPAHMLTCSHVHHNLTITIHARVILLIANSSSRRRLHTKVKMAKCIFGDQVRKQNFPTFHICILFWYFCKISFGRDLGTECIVTTAFQSVPTTKKCVNFFCVGVSMLTKKEYND